MTPGKLSRLRRPSRRVLLLPAGAVILVAAVVLVLTDPFGGSGSGNAGAGVVDNSFPTGLASVTRRSLTAQTQVSATLGYAGPSTIVEPVGTAPSAVGQAEQSVAAGQATLETAQTTLVADRESLAQVQAALTGMQAKRAVDCLGNNAAEGAPTSPAASGGGSASGACASDVQAISTGQQSLSGDTAKLAADQTQVSAAASALAAARSALAQANASGAVYGQSSTYTALAGIGEIVTRGRSLYAVSDQPVVLLYGPVAAWRAFVPGMSAGRDVAELNANLRALGYGRDLNGDAFTAATAAAVAAFQSARGVSPTGRLLLGSVVFEPGPVRVTSVTPTIGATVQPGPVLTVTSTVREVTISLDASQQAEVKVGDPVEITLPDNRTTPGKVSYVGTVATTPSASSDQGGGPSNPTIEVDVTPTDPAATGRLDQAPVNVSITTASVANALVVPVDALLALGSGGYALEEPSAGGAHRLVAVSLGLFDDADGLVQVTGAGVAPGQHVVVPSE